MKKKTRNNQIKTIILIAAILSALSAGVFTAIHQLQLRTSDQSMSNRIDSRSPVSDFEKRMGENSLTPEPITSPQAVPALIPTTHTLTGGTHTFQTFNNCGPASLSMALSYYDIAVSQQVLGAALRPYQHPTGDNDDKSVTLAELATKAAEYGLQPYHRPAGTREILEELIAAGFPVVTRTWLHAGEDIGHYRVIIGYDRDTGVLIQDDSLQGKNLEYSYESFEELWRAFNYEFLVLVPPEKESQVETILRELNDEETAWLRALTLSETQLSSDPNDIYASFNQAVAYFHLQEYESAIRSYEAVESQLPTRMLWYQLEPLLAYYEVGADQVVLERTEQILTNSNRAYSELHWLRAQVFEKQGLKSEAAAAYSMAEQYNSSVYWKSNLE